MAKNKILGLMNAFQGIKDITGIAMHSLRKTTIDALKTLASSKAFFEVPKQVQANAKDDVGLEDTRNPEVTKKKTEGPITDKLELRRDLNKDLLTKPGSKQ